MDPKNAPGLLLWGIDTVITKPPRMLCKTGVRKNKKSIIAHGSQEGLAGKDPWLRSVMMIKTTFSKPATLLARWGRRPPWTAHLQSSPPPQGGIKEHKIAGKKHFSSSSSFILTNFVGEKLKLKKSITAPHKHTNKKSNKIILRSFLVRNLDKTENVIKSVEKKRPL